MRAEAAVALRAPEHEERGDADGKAAEPACAAAQRREPHVARRPVELRLEDVSLSAHTLRLVRTAIAQRACELTRL